MVAVDDRAVIILGAGLTFFSNLSIIFLDRPKDNLFLLVLSKDSTYDVSNCILSADSTSSAFLSSLVEAVNLANLELGRELKV